MARRRFTQFGLVLVTFSLAFIACGEDGAPGGGAAAAAGPAIDEIPSLFAEALCGRYTACLGPVGAVLGIGESCVADVRSEVEDRDFAATKRLVAEKKLSYDPASARACIDALEALPCEELTNPEPAACAATFGGTVALGSACSVDAECGSQGYCKAAAACPGVCTAKGAAGEACSTDDDCSAQLGCAGGKCRKPAAVGAKCDDDGVVCVTGSLCAIEGNDDEGICKRIADLPTPGTGERCDPRAGSVCGAGNVCVYTGTNTEATYNCAPKVASGADCTFALPDPCPDDEYCPVAVSSTPVKLDAVCTKRLATGEACGAGGDGSGGCRKGDSCLPGQQGEPATCTTVQRLGGACSSNEACFSGVCDKGACVEGLACDPRRD